MVFVLVLAELVSASGVVVALSALERPLAVVEPLVASQVTLLHEGLAALTAHVVSDPQVGSHVTLQLASLWGEVRTLWKLAVEDLACKTNTSYVIVRPRLGNRLLVMTDTYKMAPCYSSMTNTKTTILAPC